MGAGDLDIWTDYVTVINAQRLNALRSGVISNKNNLSNLHIDIASNSTQIYNLDLGKLDIDGSLAMTGALNMGSRLITNMTTPTAYHHAVNKSVTDNLSEAVYNISSTYFRHDGLIPMTGVIKQYGDSDILELRGGESYGARISLTSQDYVSNPGWIWFSVPNGAKNNFATAGYIDGVTNTPKLYIYYGVLTNTIEEYPPEGATGILIDGLRLKDGGFSLGSDAQGDIYFRGADSTLKRLGASTNGYFLMTQGAAADPVWAAIPGGDMLKSVYDPDADGIIEGAQLDLSSLTNGEICNSGEDKYLYIHGGKTLGAYLYLQGSGLTGNIILATLNAAKTDQKYVFTASCGDTPFLHVNNGINVNIINEQTTSAGVTIEGLEVIDAGFALGWDADGDLYTRISGKLARLAKGTAYQRLRMKSDASTQEWADEITTLTFIIDGGGEAITTGQKGHLEVPFACTIQQATMLADQTGSIVVDIWKDTFANYPPADADSITASAQPTISSAVKSQDSTLSGWTTAVTAGDILAFNVDSCSTITRVTVSLKVKKA